MFVSGGSKLDRPSTLSFEHDPNDVIHDRRAVELDEVHLCARDVHVDTHGNLPDLWGRWTRMLYHIRATADSTGLIEVWADDQPITTVTGRIGFDEGPAARQYFKFGPYRNHPGYDSYAILALHARAAQGGYSLALRPANILARHPILMRRRGPVCCPLNMSALIAILGATPPIDVARRHGSAGLALMHRP